MNHHHICIEAGRADRQYWQDIWRYRELFAVLAWRDVAVRYKQTVIGASWAVLQPFATLVVFTILFGYVAKLPTEGSAPYPLLVFAGLLPWQLFASSAGAISNSLVGNSNLISKVYFPRLIVPASAMVVCLIDFAISLLLLAGLMLWFAYLPGWQLLLLPCFIAMAVLASLGPGLLIASLNVKYRDFRIVIPFIIQMGLYVSPVGFSSNVVPDQWRLLYSLNPMVGVIDGFRWVVLGGNVNLFWPGFLLSWCVIVFFLWLGVRRFRMMERSFADLI